MSVTDSKEKEGDQFFMENEAADTNVNANHYTLDFDDEDVECVGDDIVGSFTSSQWPQSYKSLSFLPFPFLLRIYNMCLYI